MPDCSVKDNEKLIEFWSSAFELSEEEKEEQKKADAESWKELAPSQKLFSAAQSLGCRSRVLDYGCGNAWAGIVAAKSGCHDVTAVDPAKGAIETARFCAGLYGTEEQITFHCAGLDWLLSVPSDEFDGVICSNVLDVVPEETAEKIIAELARIAAPGASVIIGLNFYLSPDEAKERERTLENGKMLYIDGVLRLVSRNDEEWKELFSRFFTVEKLEHFAWEGESVERRRLFYLKKFCCIE